MSHVYRSRGRIRGHRQIFLGSERNEDCLGFEKCEAGFWTGFEVALESPFLVDRGSDQDLVGSWVYDGGEVVEKVAVFMHSRVGALHKPQVSPILVLGRSES